MTAPTGNETGRPPGAERRVRDIQHELGVLQGTAHCLELRFEARRKTLKEAGIEQSEIERLVPPITPEQAAELAARVEALSAELASLEASMPSINSEGADNTALWN